VYFLHGLLGCISEIQKTTHDPLQNHWTKTYRNTHQAEPLQQQFSTEKRLGLISSSNFQHHDPFEQSHKKKSWKTQVSAQIPQQPVEKN